MRVDLKSLACWLCASIGLIGAAACTLGSSPASGEASHAGWPPIGNLEQAGNGGRVLRGRDGVHNELLGGDGNDTIYAGDEGDVIWGDKNPGGQPATQHDLLFGGPGNDWIYASHGRNDIFTGAGNDHLALVYGYGQVHCDGPGLKTLVMRKLPENRHWRLIGCRHLAIVPYAA
jgi:RTX calcium-binding nonapeptide repeat (4 copies)